MTRRNRGRRIPEAVSIQFTAELLDVSAITVRRWIKRGYILAYRIGPQIIRIPRSEIKRMREHRLPFLIEDDVPRYQVVQPKQPACQPARPDNQL